MRGKAPAVAAVAAVGRVGAWGRRLGKAVEGMKIVLILPFIWCYIEKTVINRWVCGASFWRDVFHFRMVHASAASVFSRATGPTWKAAAKQILLLFFFGKK